MSPPLALLMLIVLAAFAVEASLGFGSALVTVALGSMVMPIDALLPAFLPLNLALSIYLSTRYFRHVDKRLLLFRMLPVMLLGIPIGLMAFRVLPPSALKRSFGAFVIGLAAIEIVRLARGGGGAAPPLGRAKALTLLLLGGVVHGAFATGGPLAVYVTGRELGDDKARFRATLSMLWLVLNAAMLAGYAALGRIDGVSLRTTLVLAAPLAIGLLAGELLHARFPMKTFKLTVFAVLAAAGGVLLARG